MSCAVTTSLGAYVLGAVDDAERGRIDTHLELCGECRHTLERLIPLPGFLAVVSVQDVVALDAAAPPPAGLLARLRAAVVVERRRTFRVRAVAVAAIVAALAGATTAVVGGQDGPAPSRRAAVVDPRSGVSASVVATPSASGTALTVSMRGAPPGERCRLVARARDGRAEVAATWQATYRGSAAVTGTAAIAPADLAAVDVVTVRGHRLAHMSFATQEDST
jgi:hypothetical protein